MKNFIGFTAAFVTLILACTAAPRDDTLTAPFSMNERQWKQVSHQNENINMGTQKDLMQDEDLMKSNQWEQERQQPSLLSQLVATWQPIQEKMTNVEDDLLGRTEHKNSRKSENRKDMLEGEYLRPHSANYMPNEDNQQLEPEMSTLLNNKHNRHHMNLKLSDDDEDMYKTQHNNKDWTQNRRTDSEEQGNARLYKSKSNRNYNMENSREMTKIQMHQHPDNESQPQNQRNIENKIRARNQKPVVQTTGEELMNVVYKN